MAWHAQQTGGYNLDSNEAKENANEVAAIFSGEGFSLLAYSAICGAFQQECSMNPWQWEFGPPEPSYNIDPNDGYGLPQFTPSNGPSGYIGVANTLGDAQINANYSPNFSDINGTPNDGASQCYFMARYHMADADYGWFTSIAQHYQQYLELYISSADAYAAVNMPLSNFISSLDSFSNPYSIDAMIGAFVACYLRPSESVIRDYFGSTYLTYARWYKAYFEGHPPEPPTPPTPVFTSTSKIKPWWYTPFLRR